MRNTIAAGKADNACQVLRLMLLMTKNNDDGGGDSCGDYADDEDPDVDEDV